MVRLGGPRETNVCGIFSYERVASGKNYELGVLSVWE